MEFDFASPIFWFSLATLLLIVELLGAGALFSIIFAFGAVISGILSIAFDNITLLFVTFVMSSGLGVVFIKPILDRTFNKTSARKSNNDAIINKTGYVTTEIQPSKKGYVKIGNEEWSALCLNETTLPINEKIIVRRIEGVTVYVEKFED